MFLYTSSSSHLPLICVVQDLVPNGDLFTCLQEGIYLGNTTVIKSIFSQVLEGVKHCHSIGIFHRDLVSIATSSRLHLLINIIQKPENILVTEQLGRCPKVMIADFGLATDRIVTSDFNSGSELYMSPGAFNYEHSSYLLLKLHLQNALVGTDRQLAHSPLPLVISGP